MGGITKNDSIGVGQTWQTPARTSGTNYQNLTGKPILITANGSASVSPLTIIVDGVTVATSQPGLSVISFVSAIVPNNSTYSYNFVGILNVTELR